MRPAAPSVRVGLLYGVWERCHSEAEAFEAEATGQRRQHGARRRSRNRQRFADGAPRRSTRYPGWLHAEQACTLRIGKEG
eukprot:366175-Chlamydomonas_euryale.AAC.5